MIASGKPWWRGVYMVARGVHASWHEREGYFGGVRMRKSSGALFVVLALFAAACSSDTSEEIQGIWFDSTNGVYLELDANDEFKVAVNSDVEGPFEMGSYTFDGETLTMNTTTFSPNCPDTSVTWTVVFSADGDEANMTFVDDSCPGAERSKDLVLVRQSS